MRKKYFLFVPVLLVVIIYVTQEDKSSIGDSESRTGPSHSAAGLTHGVTRTGKAVVVTPTHQSNTNPKSPPLTNEEFDQWIATDSLKIERPSGDLEEVEAEVRGKAERLTEQQLQELRKIVEDVEASGHARIFSNYVLMNNFSETSDRILIELTRNAAPDEDAPQRRGADGEKKRNQNYALKFMQIEETIERLKRRGEDPLRFMSDLGDKTNDPQVKAYVAQKTAEKRGNGNHRPAQR